MFTRVLAVITLLAAFSATAAEGQEWSAEQQEVWEFELGCLGLVGDTDAISGWLDCFHDEYVGWWAEDPAPGDKNSVRVQIATGSWKNTRFLTAWPMSVKVHGDVAVVHYVSKWNEGGVEVWNRWTDIALKTDGRWQWIADAGGYTGGRIEVGLPSN